MCLLVAAFRAHPDFPLVFAGNRDEYHRRPAAAADWWADAPNLLGGRDLMAGGTWLAMNRRGHLAVVTNRPDLPAPAKGSLSRGALVRDWLLGDDLSDLPHEHARYGGFSLLLTDREQMQIRSGGNGLSGLTTTTFSSGMTGLSNTALDDPWPKLTWLEQEFTRELDRKQPEPARLMQLLLRGQPVPGEHNGGVPATPFINGAEYGTRCCTVICIDRDGRCDFVERRFGPDGAPQGESEYRFVIEP